MRSKASGDRHRESFKAHSATLMELLTSSYSRRIPTQTATTSVRPTRRRALASSARAPWDSSPASPPMPSPPRQLVALSVNRQHSDEMRIPSAPPLPGPAGAPHLRRPLLQLNLQGSASHRLWEAVPAHSANRRRLAAGVRLASLQPLVAAARSGNPQLLAKPEELASPKLEGLASPKPQELASDRPQR